MTGIPDELVEKAARGYHDDFPRQSALGRAAINHPEAMRAALEAAGLPALLERVEAAEREVARFREQMWGCCPHCADDQPHIEQDTHSLPCSVCEASSLLGRVTAERDALAAKVADAWDEGREAGEYNLFQSVTARFKTNPYRAALTERTEG